MLQAKVLRKSATWFLFCESSLSHPLPTSNEIILVELLILYVAHTLNNPWIEVDVYVSLLCTLESALEIQFKICTRGKFLFFRSMWWKNFIFPWYVCFPSDSSIYLRLKRSTLIEFELETKLAKCNRWLGRKL